MYIKGMIAPKGTVSFNELYEEALSMMPDNTGALTTFTGVVRDTNPNETKKVVALYVEAWEEQGSKKMEEIATEIAEKHGLTLCILVHLTGELRIREPIVYVILGSQHRNEGFDALEEIIHRYKHDSPVWKKEIYEDGSSKWITTVKSKK